MKILVVNAGSSSYKLSLYHLQHEEFVDPLWKGSIDWGRENQVLTVVAQAHTGKEFRASLTSGQLKEGLHLLLSSLWQGETQVIEGSAAIERIGHRVVHGGPRFTQPTLVDAQVKESIRQLIPLAPLHNPANLQGIDYMEKSFPHCPQVAVFDTAFHLTMPDMIKTYPVPWNWKEKGIQRYGFHGISHHYCAERTAQFLQKDPQNLKIINCHLGNGCSLCAIQEGKSYETTMGFTPLEGLMMGTRCGSIDPGILLYLMREHQFSEKELEHILNFESGLKGIGGFSDMRELMDRQTEELPRLAVSMFIHRLKTAIGALVVSLDGFHVLSFTGGIGEHAPYIREQTCRGLSCLGVALDQEKNRACQPDQEITASDSSVRVIVLHTQEEWMIANACFKL